MMRLSIRISCLALICLAVGGCATAASTTFRGSSSAPGKLSSEDLREAINDYEDKAVGLVRLGGEELDRSGVTDRVKKTDLIRRIRIIQAVHAMASIQEPKTAYIELWTLTVRLKLYAQQSPDEIWTAAGRKRAVDMTTELETDIEAIGRQFLGPSDFAATQKQVQDFARQHSINDSFSNIVTYATQTTPGQSGKFQNIMSIPLAPFKAMEGVDRSASAIYSLSDSADRIADIVEQLPESAKWQALLFTLEVGDTEMARTLLADFTRISQSSEKIAIAADTLPARMRQEAGTLITEIDSKQANLQVTLDKTQATATALEKTLAEADKALASLNKTSASINETTKSWEAAANATGSAVGVMKAWADEPGDPNSPPFDINNYTKLAVEMNKTATEVKATIKEAKELIGNGETPGAIGEIDKRLARRIDSLTIRLAGLLVMAFLLALAYKRITSKWK